MTLARLLLLAAVLTPGATLAQETQCSDHTPTCAAGSVYDAETNSCKMVTG
ncbi:adenylosuccinate lyase [Pseudoprimorskyibacter insulae]|uniref:Adenylosuccinate lyase n=1 Tax=Pseudoprimorskyibacter insulae TaxID=1695997 RepID=A0A2R8AYC5_9RHOB|nr:adenylosuccinate lyase [Pseudoprimorskyibacter insulae]SPF80864.1 hypothetical protein PRI8871_02677 [Pseudoprimorskyibacter insulae]